MNDEKADRLRHKVISRLLDKGEAPRIVDIARRLPPDTWDKIRQIMEEK